MIFLFIKVSEKQKCIKTLFSIDNNSNCILSTNKNVKMISEGSCDTEAWSNGWLNSMRVFFLILRTTQSKSVTRSHCFSFQESQTMTSTLSFRMWWRRRKMKGRAHWRKTELYWGRRGRWRSSKLNCTQMMTVGNTSVTRSR